MNAISHDEKLAHEASTARLQLGGRSLNMVRKIDGPGPRPPKAKLSWTAWLMKYLEDEPDASVEDYLAWCRKTFDLKEQYRRMVNNLVANPYFQAWLRDHRQRLDVDPELIKGMSAEELARWDRLVYLTTPELWQHLLLQCQQLSLSPAWIEFIQCMVLFGDGSPAYHGLLDIVNCWLDPDSHMLTIKVRVEHLLKKEETGARLWAKVRWAKRQLFGRDEFRLHEVDFGELDKRHLFLVLVEFEGYTETEVFHMLDRYEETGTIDESIRRVYPAVSEEKLRRFLDDLVRLGFGYDDIHTTVKNNAARLGLKPIDPSLFGDWYRFWHFYLDEGQFNWPPP